MLWHQQHFKTISRADYHKSKSAASSSFARTRPLSGFDRKTANRTNYSLGLGRPTVYDRLCCLFLWQWCSLFVDTFIAVYTHASDTSLRFRGNRHRYHKDPLCVHPPTRQGETWGRRSTLSLVRDSCVCDCDCVCFAVAVTVSMCVKHNSD